MNSQSLINIHIGEEYVGFPWTYSYHPEAQLRASGLIVYHFELYYTSHESLWESIGVSDMPCRILV